MIEGLDRTATDVLIRFVAEEDAAAQTLRLTPDAITIVLPEVPSAWGVFLNYMRLGADHILGGIDHLLFVLALLLLIRNVRRKWSASSETSPSRSLRGGISMQITLIR